MAVHLAAVGRQLSSKLPWLRYLRARMIRDAPKAGVNQRVTLERRRIYALPTRYGVFLAVMLFVMLLGSINYNNSLGFMLTFLLASLGVLSILYTYRNIAHLTLEAGKVAAVFAGDTAYFRVHIHNNDRQARLALQLRLQGGKPVMIDVPPRLVMSVALPLPAPRRGRLTAGRITVSTVFPLGLIRAWSYLELDLHCLVYPKPGPLQSWSKQRQRQHGDVSTLDHGSDDFLGLRAYQPGDSPRHIHWKAVAREQPLLTKQFAASASAEQWLDWDALPQLDSETRLRYLCRQVLEAETQGLRYGVRLPGRTIAPEQGAAHQHRCLEALALFAIDDLRFEAHAP